MCDWEFLLAGSFGIRRLSRDGSGTDVLCGVGLVLHALVGDGVCAYVQPPPPQQFSHASSVRLPPAGRSRTTPQTPSFECLGHDFTALQELRLLRLISRPTRAAQPRPGAQRGWGRQPPRKRTSGTPSHSLGHRRTCRPAQAAGEVCGPGETLLQEGSLFRAWRRFPARPRS